MDLQSLPEVWKDQLRRETKRYLVHQINDWAIGAWHVCLRLHRFDDADRFAEVAVHAKHRLEELDDAEQDTDTLVGR